MGGNCFFLNTTILTPEAFHWFIGQQRVFNGYESTRRRSACDSNGRPSWFGIHFSLTKSLSQYSVLRLKLGSVCNRRPCILGGFQQLIDDGKMLTLVVCHTRSSRLRAPHSSGLRGAPSPGVTPHATHPRTLPVASSLQSMAGGFCTARGCSVSLQQAALTPYDDFSITGCSYRLD